MIRRRFIVGVGLVALFALGFTVGRGTSGDLYANLDVFVEVMQRVEENYVNPVKPSELVDGGIKGMLHDLDPYSQYLDAEDYAGLKDMTYGEFSGIGAVIGVREDYPTVISALEGGPAAAAGIHSGDIIVAIDGKTSSGLTVDDASKRLRGKAGTTVRLHLRREGVERDEDVTLVRREIETRSVPYAFRVGTDLGYVRIASFSEKSGAEVRAALDKLKAEGARRFVLDLRQNPGGVLDQAVDVAEQFLPKGSLVVTTRGRQKAQDHRYYADLVGADLRSPLAVLIDGGSASASEIVAGALQDLDRALVVGGLSYGKGSVQSVFPLRGRTTALKLTTALYYTPSGRSIHRKNPGPADDDGEDDAAPADSAASDSARALPIFHTARGRVVYGGGGITPDLKAVDDSLSRLLKVIEQKGLAFRFANKWANTHPTRLPGARLEPSIWTGFVQFVRAEGVEAPAADLERERAGVERAVRRELARRAGGDREAMRVVLEGDRVYARAAAALERATRAQDVFAGTAGVPDRTRDSKR